ncbi:MAG: CRTAC1 family protein [Limisphaerales bacterium]
MPAAPPQDEPPAADPAAVRRAFWASLATLLVLAAAVTVIVLRGRGARTGPAAPPSAATEEALARLVPEAKFTDITAAAGLAFTHFTGAEGERLLPETMGGGLAFLDFDGDGDADLLFVNGAPWPWATNPPARPPTHALYRNDTPPGGAVRFTDVTAGSGLDVTFYGMGVACGDYDADGRVDVFISGVGDQRLFRNEGGGKFRDVTAAAGLVAPEHAWGTSCGFLDQDRDGDLDLFVCHYVRWSREMDLEVDYRLPGIGRAYGPPMNFPGNTSRLYRNDGGGRFTDVTAAAGVEVRNPATGLPMAKSLGLAPTDLDHDGWPDVIVANDTVQNFVFTNRHDGTFAEVGALSGIAFDSYGGARGAMGIDVGRFTEDDTLGVSIGNFANEMLALYVAQRDALLFSDQAIAQGVGAASRQWLTFGVFFFDYDLDGWLDLLTANGHIEPDIGRVQPGQQFRQPAQLFWNARGARVGAGFAKAGPGRAGADLFRPLVGRGSAFADVDGDGDLDVVIAQAGGPPVLLRNDQRLGHAWLRVKLVQPGPNRDALGAWVRLRAGGRGQWRQLMPTRSYLAQSELPVTFGLGRATRVEELEVDWPDGRVQRVPAAKLRLNALNVISPEE